MQQGSSAIPRFLTLVEPQRGCVLGTDETGSVRYCSAAAPRYFGYAESDLIGAKVADLIVADMSASGDPEQAALEATAQRGDGTTIPIDLTVVSVKVGASDLIVWVVREPQNPDALEDRLTHLPNATFVRERIRERLEQARIAQGSFAVFTVALEGLASINAALGRGVGDAAVLESVERLRHGVPSADVVGRLGGAEFCVVTAQAQPAEMDALAHTLAETLSYPITVNNDRLEVSPRIGIAMAPADGTTVELLIERAQTALDRARETGVPACFFSSDITKGLKARRSLEQALRAALDTQDFSLDFLPIVDLATGSVTGAEALLRWNDPIRGSVPPLEFIPLAEERGLMVPIGAWVVRESLRQAKAWRDAGRALRVSVNVTARQLQAPGFARQLAASIATSGFPPEALELEITESAAMQQAAIVNMLLAEVRRMGVKIALDDFGTGYSSMAYLKSLPVDIIKIDRSFIDGVPADNADTSIVRAIIAFALCTGRNVRAEGVTTAEQARWLHAEGCEDAQGFFFSKPIPGDRILEWLQAEETQGRAEAL